MLAKAVVLAALVAVVSASIPITSPISLAQRLASIQGSISHSDCVPCEEAMGHAIHTAAEAGQQNAHLMLFYFFLNNALPALPQFVSGWMGEWMDKICPYLNEKYGWSWQLCDIAAYLIMNDVGNHLQPDAVYNCEQIGNVTPFLFSFSMLFN
jgi:hypothetical protein